MCAPLTFIILSLGGHFMHNTQFFESWFVSGGHIYTGPTEILYFKKIKL